MADYELLDQNGQPRYITKRTRYYDNQVLIDQDFIDEQKFHLDRRQRHERQLHVSGICDGLTVQAMGGLKVSIAPGTALDTLGRQVLLEMTTEFVVSRVGTQRLYIRFREEESDEMARGKGAAGKTRFWLRPEISAVSPDSLPQYAVVLATIDATSTIATIKSEGREYSGMRLPGPVTSGAPTLRSGGDTAYSTAVLTGTLSVSGNFSAAAVKVLGSAGSSVFEVKTDGSLTAGTGSSPPFQLNNAGAITAATGITTSGNIKLTSLPGSGATSTRFVKVGTEGTLLSIDSVDLSGSEVSNTLPFLHGGTGQTSWTTNALVFVSGNNSLGSIVPAAQSILSTNSSCVPALAQTLPDIVQTNITRVGTLNSLSVGTGFNRFTVSDGGSISGASGLSVGTSTTRFVVDANGALISATGLSSSGTVRLSSLPGAGATSARFVKVGTDGTLNSTATVDLSSAEVNNLLPTVRGGTGQASWTTNALVFASESTRLTGINPVASSVLSTNASSIPALTQVLPTVVQDNITRLGTVTSGALGSGFGDITTPTLNVTTALKTAGVTRIDTSGNLPDVGTIFASGQIRTTNSSTSSGQGGIAINRTDDDRQAGLRFLTAGNARWHLQMNYDNTEHLYLQSEGGPGFVQSWDYVLANSTLRGDLNLDNVFVGPGTVTLKNSTTDTLQGDGTSFHAMAVGDQIRVNNTWYTIASVASSTELKVTTAVSGVVSGTQYAYAWRSANAYVSGSGKVSLRSGTQNTLIGSGTSFLALFQPGDEIRITVSQASNLTARVASVNSESELVLKDSVLLTEGTQYSFSVRKLTRRIKFGAARQSLIELNSSSAETSDKGFLLFQEHSTEYGGTSAGTENARLSLGILGDIGSSNTETLDLQGAHKLTLNVGAWDSELNASVGTISSSATPAGFSFRVHNSEKLSIDSTGKLSIGATYSGTAATLLAVGTSSTAFTVTSAGSISGASSLSVGTSSTRFAVDNSGALTSSSAISVGTATNKFTVDSTGAISAATSASFGTSTTKFAVDSSGAITSSASLSVGTGSSKFTVDSTGAITAVTSITSSGAFTLSGLSSSTTGTKFVRLGTDNKVATTTSVDLTSSDVTGTLPFGRGGTGATTFTTNGVVYGSSSSALSTTSAAASSILVTSSASVPSLSTTLPSGVQDNITRLGAVTSGSIGSGFGTVTTTTLNATTGVQTAGTTRLDSSGNLSAIASLTFSTSTDVSAKLTSLDGLTLYIDNADKFSFTSAGKFRGPSGATLFKVEQFSNTGGSSKNTSYSTTDWYACVIGFDAGSGDLYENNSGSNLLKCYCYESSGYWYVKSDIRTHNDTTWTIYILFIHKCLM